jgi:ABC-2 type transport system ATP-binding protein
MQAVKVDSLVKEYKTSFSLKKLVKEKQIKQNIIALNEVSFSIEKGEIYGILGPNGAGKTTLIKVLATILLPDSGRVNILGYELAKDEKKIRTKIGISLGEYERTFHWRLTGRQNLTFFANIFGLKKIEIKKKVNEVLDTMGLQKDGDKLFFEYSTGMKHKLAIARALLNDPELLLFDEPTAGLDVKTSKDVGILVKNFAKNGTTIVYTTHRIKEAGDLCDRILILDKGKKIVEEKPNTLKKITHETEILQIKVNKSINQIIKNINEIKNIKNTFIIENNIMRIHCKSIDDVLPEIIKLLKSKAYVIEEINTPLPSISDAFLKIVEEKT